MFFSHQPCMVQSHFKLSCFHPINSLNDLFKVMVYNYFKLDDYRFWIICSVTEPRLKVSAHFVLAKFNV